MSKPRARLYFVFPLAVGLVLGTLPGPGSAQVVCPPTGSFSDDFEPGAMPGWVVDTNTDFNTPSDPWAVRPDPMAHSLTNSFHSDAAGSLDLKDDRLVAPPQDLSSTSRVIFWHRFNFEDTFDGGVLEVSTNGGTTWTDVGAAAFVENGYNGVIDTDFNSPIAGRDAWTGISTSIEAMIRVTANLGAFAGTDRLVRWRLAMDPLVPGSIPGVAWWVDDVSFTNLSVNCPPVAVDDSATTVNGFPVTINVIANDSDPNGDTLTVTAVTDPPGGTAVNNGDGTVTYTPDCPVVSGSDTFTYTIDDGNGGTDTALVTVRNRKTSRRPSIDPCGGG